VAIVGQLCYLISPVKNCTGVFCWKVP